MEVASKIIGLGAYIPEREITNDDVLQMLKDHSAAYMHNGDLEALMGKAAATLNKAGNVTRYWCRPDQYTTDIARIASERAMEHAGIAADEIDLIIYTGMSKAFVEPATAHVLRDELKAYNANVIDTQDACTSVMKSAQIADALIKTGAYRTVLIAVGERSFDWADFRCKTIEELSWKIGALTIGDAAGAVIMQRTEEAVYCENPKHMQFYSHIMPGTFATCHIGLNHRIGDRYRLYSHASNLVRTGLTAILELLPEVLNQPGWENLTYENLFIHDIGKIIDILVLPALKEAQVHIPDTYKSFYDRYGNVGSASISVQLWEAMKDGRMQRGNLSACIFPAAGVQAGIWMFVY